MVDLKLDTDSPAWLEARTIILAPTGSYAYGTSTEESDKDYKGVCIPSEEYYLGLQTFNEYNNSGRKNYKNTKDDVDVSILHVNKFVRDAMQGIPNNIELLFIRPEDYLKVTPLGQLLIDNRHLFLSKQVKNKFGGFARSQIQKLKKGRTDGIGRIDLIRDHGFDTKFAYHSIRLLTSAVEILTTGDFSTFRPNRKLLLDIRNGEISFDEVLELIEYYDNLLNLASHQTPLPDKPDYSKVNNLLVEINKRGLKL